MFEFCIQKRNFESLLSGEKTFEIFRCVPGKFNKGDVVCLKECSDDTECEDCFECTGRTLYKKISYIFEIPCEETDLVFAVLGLANLPGWWLYDDKYDRYVCSKCGNDSSGEFDFCPNCGSKMGDGPADGIVPPGGEKTE